MNNAIKRAAAVLAANKNKPKAKPAPRRRPGAVRPNPVPEIQPASPNEPYGVMSPSNMMEYAAKIENGRKKAANKLNAKLKEIKATKGKTPTPVRLKEKFSFVDIKGKKREFVRKFAYDRALAKNKAERAKTKAKTPTPKAKWSNANNKQFMELLAREKNAQRKLANKMNKTRPLKNGPLDPAVAYALKTPKPSTAKKVVKNYMNKFVNKLSNDERNMLKKKVCD
jgi:hypothetical protein